MAVWITGDIHGGVDIRKLTIKNFPEGRLLSKSDYVIILGDFGLIWSNPISRSEKYWLNWLNERPWTTLFIDGNHENHILLNELSITERFGGKVGVVSDSIYYLKRGEIYEINNKKILAFGGAQTTDMESKIWKGGDKFKIVRRIEGRDWWREELPSEIDKQNAWNNLKKNNYKVDYIIAHTLPSSIIEKYDRVYVETGRKTDPTSLFLDEICMTIEFDKYFCGHFHDDYNIDNFCMLFDSLVEV